MLKRTLNIIIRVNSPLNTYYLCALILLPALIQNMTMYPAVTCQMAVLTHDSRLLRIKMYDSVYAARVTRKPNDMRFSTAGSSWAQLPTSTDAANRPSVSNPLMDAASARRIWCLR